MTAFQDQLSVRSEKRFVDVDTDMAEMVKNILEARQHEKTAEFRFLQAVEQGLSRTQAYILRTYMDGEPERLKVLSRQVTRHLDAELRQGLLSLRRMTNEEVAAAISRAMQNALRDLERLQDVQIAGLMKLGQALTEGQFGLVDAATRFVQQVDAVGVNGRSLVRLVEACGDEWSENGR